MVYIIKYSIILPCILLVTSSFSLKGKNVSDETNPISDWPEICKKLKTKLEHIPQTNIVWIDSEHLTEHKKYAFFDFYDIRIPLPNISYDAYRLINDDDYKELSLASKGIFTVRATREDEIKVSNIFSKNGGIENLLEINGAKATSKMFGGDVSFHEVLRRYLGTSSDDVSCTSEKRVQDSATLTGLIFKQSLPSGDTKVYRADNGWITRSALNEKLVWEGNFLVNGYYYHITFRYYKNNNQEFDGIAFLLQGKNKTTHMRELMDELNVYFSDSVNNEKKLKMLFERLGIDSHPSFDAPNSAGRGG